MSAAVALLAAAALMVPALRDLRQTPPPEPPETRLDLVTPPTDDHVSFALSPDGRQIIYVGSGESANDTWSSVGGVTRSRRVSGGSGGGVRRPQRGNHERGSRQEGDSRDYPRQALARRR